LQQAPRARVGYWQQVHEAVSEDFAGDRYLPRRTEFPSNWIKGFNITADSAETLANGANQFLAAPNAIIFSLADVDRAFVDFLIATRNYLEPWQHRSLAIMKQSVKEIHEVPLRLCMVPSRL